MIPCIRHAHYLNFWFWMQNKLLSCFKFSRSVANIQKKTTYDVGCINIELYLSNALRRTTKKYTTSFCLGHIQTTFYNQWLWCHRQLLFYDSTFNVLYFERRKNKDQITLVLRKLRELYLCIEDRQYTRPHLVFTN